MGQTYPVQMSSMIGPEPLRLFALQSNFDVIIEKRDYDIKNLIMMQWIFGLLALDMRTSQVCCFSMQIGRGGHSAI